MPGDSKVYDDYKKALCKKHSLSYGSYGFIDRFTCDELTAKINYLLKHNLPMQNKDGLRHEIFYLSNDQMKKKYGISKQELISKYLFSDDKDKKK